MNLRSLTNFRNGYYEINREERNLAAIFYHALLINDNTKKFLNKIYCELPIIENQIGIYFEYAYIRDLWNRINQGNEFKLQLTLYLLQPNNRLELEKSTVYDFNKYFVAIPTFSSDHLPAHQIEH